MVDDFVVRRNDGTHAYNLAVVVDDAAQGIGEVVRGDDLLDSTPRQLWLAAPRACREPPHAHVPLVLGPDGTRLAKRHGAVTLDRAALGRVARTGEADAAGACAGGGSARAGRAGERPSPAASRPLVGLDRGPAAPAVRRRGLSAADRRTASAARRPRPGTGRARAPRRTAAR